MYPMTPYFPWRDRIRLAWAILRGKMWVGDVEEGQWGQTISLRTLEDERVM
jgi:hypothetical protein